MSQQQPWRNLSRKQGKPHQHTCAHFFGVEADEGLEYRLRVGYDRKTGYAQMFASAALFDASGAGESKQTQKDVRRALYAIIDADIAEYPYCPPEWGATVDERKDTLARMTRDEVVAWVRDSGYLEQLRAVYADHGLPQYSRLLYTGHGYQFFLQLPAEYGTAGTGLRNYEHTKNAWKSFVAALRESVDWCVDAKAKDLGTRVTPLTGNTNRKDITRTKVVEYVEQHEVDDGEVAAFWARICAQYTGPAKTDNTRRPKNTAQLVRGVWDIEQYGAMPEHGEKILCPTCPEDKTPAANRVDRDGQRPCVYCHRCTTTWRVRSPVNRDWSFVFRENVVQVEFDENGYAKWPAELAEVAVLAVRTGAGKSTVMGNILSAWPGHVLCISPTVALAAEAARKYGIAHACQGSTVTLAQGSCATALARLDATLSRVLPSDVGTYCVMLDEVEAMLRQLDSILGRRAEIYALLVQILARAARIVLADAHAAGQTRQLLQDVADARKALELPERTPIWYVSEATRFRLRYYPDQIDAKGNTVRSHTIGLSELCRDVEAGERCIVYAFSKNTCRGLAAALRLRYPEKQIVCITANDTQEEAEARDWDLLRTADVCVHNGAMGSGVSIDAGHYTQSYMFTENSMQVDRAQLEQAAHRDRGVLLRRIKVFGTIRDEPDNQDDRVRVEWHQEQAVAAYCAAEEIALNYGVSLHSAGLFAPDTIALHRQQLAARAQSCADGRGWALGQFLLAHDSELADAATVDCRPAKEVRQAKKAAKVTRSARTLSAVPCTDERAKQVAEGDLPVDADELAAVDAHAILRETGGAIATPELASQLAAAQADKQLNARVALVVLAQAFRRGGEAAEKTLKWYRTAKLGRDATHSKTTIASSKKDLSRARDLARLLDAVYAGAHDGVYVLNGQHMRAHSALLRRIFVKVKCRQHRQDGMVVRTYSVTLEDIEASLALGAAKLRECLEWIGD